MSKILVNGNKEVEGKLTVDRELDFNSNPQRIVIIGYFATENYFEEITEIETDKLKLKDVFVFKESFGSEEDKIVYELIAEDLEVKEV